MKEYNFYGWKQADVKALTDEYPGIRTPIDLYEALSDVWCRETCAPRMRIGWTEENPTYGQCSITAFLVQDIFGGKVYGTPLEDGSPHCFNEVDGRVFDLTSEQFGGKVLDYNDRTEQFREDHFSRDEKKERYDLLCAGLREKLRKQ